MNGRSRYRLLVVFAGGCLLCQLALISTGEDKAQPIPTQTVADKVRQAMLAKTSHAQGILHGLVTRDFEEIQRAAAKLKQVSLDAPKDIEGDEVDNELYHHFRLEFLRIATQLEKMAEAKNVEGAAFAYQSLTANCLACHSYLHGDEQIRVLK